MSDAAPREPRPAINYASIVSATVWPAALIASNGQIRAASPPAVTLLGGAGSGTLLESALVAADRMHLRHLMDQVLSHGIPAVARVRVERPGQPPQQIEADLLPVADLGEPHVTAVLYPHSLAFRRNQLTLECNLLTPRLLHAQSAEDVYVRVAASLGALGFGITALTYTDDRRALRVVYDTGSPIIRTYLEEQAGGRLADARIDAAAPLVADVLATQRAVFHATAAPLVEWQLRPEDAALVLSAQRVIGMRGFIFAPLMMEEALRGILVVWGHLLDRDDVPFIEAFAHQLGGALAQIDLRRRMEDQYAASARLYREAESTRRYLDAIIQNAPDAMLVCRPDMALRSLNPAPLSHTGYDIAELEGGSLLRFCPEEHHDELLRRWQEVLQGEPQRFEMELLRADGSRFSALISADLIPGYGEVLVIVKDITELRRLEAHIRQSEKLSALGRLVAGAAHELNNPLAVILGLAQLQLLEDLPERTRADILNIERAALRAAAIVQQLRLFARPQPLKPQPVDIGAVARDTLARLSAQIAAAEIVTRRSFEDEPLLVAGEPHQVEQALYNIMQNAVQALAANPPAQRRELTVHGWRDGAAVRVTVADTGPGIGHEHLPQIFEPFFTTRDVGQGLGLGLAIVHAIVRQHGGQVWASSSPERGTAFDLHLPAAAAAAHAEEQPPATLPPGLHILVVEDEELVRAVAERTLARLECRVDAVRSGDEALGKALADDYSLVISDLQMPGMDGPALYERLHAERPDLRWLILTGDTMGEHSRAFLERTALPVLPKPFTQEQLVRSVAECISG